MTLPIGRPLTLDGGLATLLERQGEDLSSSLWSAATLRANPAAITAAHTAFFEAGADVATTATYQLTPLSLDRAGVAATEFVPLVAAAVHVAREAQQAAGRGSVVGSVGPYGASLAGGQEYTGDYGLGSGTDAITALRTHHRPRLEALLEAGVDALACETLPSLVEVEALITELAAIGVDIPVWISLTPADGGRRTRTGEELAQVGPVVAGLPTAFAVGVNCIAPHDVAAALTALSPSDHGLTGVAYPNSGETWDAAARIWRGNAAWDDDAVPSWRAAGATLIGGCCRVFPEQIRLIAG